MANPKKAYDRIYAYYIKKGYTHEEADHVAKNIANKQGGEKLSIEELQDN